MPIYEYRCNGCGNDFEYQQRMSDDPKTVCESCGGALEKLISRSSFHFKGGGWYKDLYASKKDSATTKEASSDKGSDSKSAKSAESATTTPAATTGTSPTSGSSSGGSSGGSGGSSTSGTSSSSTSNG